MEDGSDGLLVNVELSDSIKNGVVSPIMANFPEGTVAVTKEDKGTKINGETGVEAKNHVSDVESVDSESGALVIDESFPSKKKRNKKIGKTRNDSDNKQKNSESDSVSVKNEINETANSVKAMCYGENNCDSVQSKNTDTHSLKNSVQEHFNGPLFEGDVLTHSNPYFNESIFELSQQHHINGNSLDETVKATKPKRTKGKLKPKLKEYAQYLGLQPTVQFKCSKCGKAGFESLNTLQDHLIQCNSVQNVQENAASETSCSGFKLKRRVFLCSACGTYYENWNLYMHMLEFHRRYICLYCLGMFSILEDLCQHIQSRHNLEPGCKNTLDEFFSVYNEPCYLVCCECNKLFNEQDNFFYHNCAGNKTGSKSRQKQAKKPILPENHVTGESTTEDGEKQNAIAKEPETIQSDGDKEKNYIKEGGDKEKTSDIDTCDSLELTGANESEELPEKIEENTEKDGEKIEEDNCINHMESNGEKDIENPASPNLEENRLENATSMENMERDGEIVRENEDGVVEATEEPKPEEPIETRKVPKLSLKLPKPGSYPEPEDSDDSEKLTMEMDHIESENDEENEPEAEPEPEPIQEEEKSEPQMQIAGPEISVAEIELEQPLDKIDIKVLLQKCLKATAALCIYCNHARKIVVNGKQLGLHAIAEHRYSSIVKSITAEELIPESFVSRIQESLNDLENVFFNLESAVSDEAVTFSHVYECFQCHYSTTVHKELYLHNRKFHSKNILLCIMCKSNFYSYSELICHLCPGQYVLDYDLQFRCCMCVSDDLPSSFRLMVHLRKRHNVCDVCLEMCHNQYKLSNHVWKHKLHHFCYRCCIAYRNKPDITRHLFWKHGTESVLCKKCLQKKWPHVYHFCVPPTSFACEECNLTFAKAVSLKVHKRLHTDERKWECTFEGCSEKFISKKLMVKHEARHYAPPEEEKKIETIEDEEKMEKTDETTEKTEGEEKKDDGEAPKPPKPKVDVYDLPELNLSESDSSDSETEIEKMEKPVKEQEPTESTIEDDKTVLETKICSEILPGAESVVETEETPVKVPPKDDENPTEVMQNIWDNFKTYQANKEKLDHMFGEPEKTEIPVELTPEEEDKLTLQRALLDHDYCMDPEKKTDTTLTEVMPDLSMAERVDHDYCAPMDQTGSEEKPPVDDVDTTKVVEEKRPESPKKKDSSSSSSSDSDSSSCSCGSNCSCSSSSGSSSSSSESSDSDSSTEEGRKKQQIRRQKRRMKNTDKEPAKSESKTDVDVVATDHLPVIAETPIQESDLDTTESETDEEFYDSQPQKLAKKILEEKRAQLLAGMAPGTGVANGTFIESTSRPPTPPAGTVEEEEPKPKKKKTKKRKKRKSEKKEHESRGNAESLTTTTAAPYYQQYHAPPTVAPITLSISRNSPVPTATITASVATTTPKDTKMEVMRQDSTDSNMSLRASKRRRVPNKFYGYSSDEEEEKASGGQAPKWRRTEPAATPRSPMIVPPITIKTGPPTPHPTVEPISIRLPPPTHPGDFRVNQKPRVPPTRLSLPPRQIEADSASDSNESEEETETATPSMLPKPDQPQLYCYCRCPYDEVSEMIGCDSSDCAIEWFHFECVGIMVPPKGQWFCPDCRKKKQMQRRDFLQV